jgi:hypothetical protein
MKPTFAVAFCVHWTRRFYPNAVIVRECADGVELRRHNGQLGLAYREVGEPLVIRPEFVLGRHDREQWCRRIANRIDCWARGLEDPEGPEAFYAELRQRLAERAPA